MSLSDDKQTDVIDAFNTKKPHFETCICQFLIILFLPKSMINETILILKLSISHF